MARPRKYSDELRERAVRFYFESDRPIAHVARDLGIHKEALRQWVRQAEADQGRRPELLTTNEREELKRLRKEVSELRRANAILKDASVYFATELDPTRRGDRVRGGAAGRGVWVPETRVALALTGAGLEGRLWRIRFALVDRPSRGRRVCAVFQARARRPTGCSSKLVMGRYAASSYS
jgi:transposase